MAPRTPDGAHFKAIALSTAGVYVLIFLSWPHTRWNLVVSQNTDDTLHQFLASQGRDRKGELSRFVEAAVRARILELEAEQPKAENSGLSPAMIEDAIDEALEWARRI
jgi:hypothetical protein